MAEDNKRVSELESLVLRLQGDKDALIGEFGNKSKNEDEVVTTIQKTVDEAAVAAIKSIVHVAEFGDTEALMLSASKYLVDLKIKLDSQSKDGDGAIKKLIERLTATTEPPVVPVEDE